MLKKASIFACLSILLFNSTPVLAQFNPHFILSNNDLTDYTAMSMEDINSFLKNKGGVLSTYIDPNVRMTTAQVIYDSAWVHQINPKYILTLLQKEQSLVTDASPVQGQFDWATGYGVCDSCSINDPAVQKYKGLANQIDWGAGAARFYLDNPQKFKYQTGGTYFIDGQEITIANDATRALYIYTPHLHGNENLYKIWNNWFSQTYPDGALLQNSKDGSIWLIQNGMRRLFKTKTALISRYSLKQVVEASPTEIEKYPLGQVIKYPNYSLLRIPTGGVYLLDNDLVRPITSQKAFKLLGFNPEEIINITVDELKNYSLGEAITVQSSYPNGALLQDKTTGGVYYVQDGEKHPLIDRLFITLYFKDYKISKVTAKELENYPKVEPIKLKDGELIKLATNPTVYFISNGAKRPINSEQTLKNLGYTARSIITVTQKVLDLHPLGEELTSNK